MIILKRPPPPKVEPPAPKAPPPKRFVLPVGPPQPCCVGACGSPRAPNSTRCKSHCWMDTAPEEARTPKKRAWVMPKPIAAADRAFTLEVTLRCPASYGEDRIIEVTFQTPHADELLNDPTAARRLSARAIDALMLQMPQLFAEAANGRSTKARD